MNQSIDNLPNAVFLGDQTRELDRIAIQEYGIPGFELMSKAARFTFHAIIKKWPEAGHLIILCGAANNAGDGYFVASLAAKRGYKVDCIALTDPSKLKNDAALAVRSCNDTSVVITHFERDKVKKIIDSATPSKEFVLVDALLGTGLSREVKGNYLEVITLANKAHKSGLPVIAIDIPSGLDTNTGLTHGVAIEADITATFIGNKLGLMTGKGRHHCGEIVFSKLEIPDEVYRQVPPNIYSPTLSSQLSKLPSRAAFSYKGNNGRALLLGGTYGFAGAVLIAAQACARVGSGLTSVITQPEHCLALIQTQPEVMAHTDTSPFAEDLFTQANVIAIGPGLGQDIWAYSLLEKALTTDSFLILDADALNLIAKHETLSKHIGRRTLLTPHPGEAARLLNCSVKEIESDRLASVHALQQRFGCHVLLKGSGTLVAHPSLLISTRQNEQPQEPPNVMLCRYGNPGMASGGMGDALTGILAGLIAQFHHSVDDDQPTIHEVIELAVNLHAAAADQQAFKKGMRGCLASDLHLSARALLNERAL